MKRNLFVFAIMLSLNILMIALSPAFGLKSSAADTGSKSEYTSCNAACQQCSDICEETLKYCLTQSGKHKDAAHVKALKDCIATCKLSKDFMTRASDLAPAVCSLCADACQRCAESCEAMKNDKQMQACAEECRKCSKACTSMKG